MEKQKVIKGKANNSAETNDNGTKQNIIKRIIEKASNKVKKEKKKADVPVTEKEKQKPEAPFKLLICVCLASNGTKVVQLLEEKGIEHSAVAKGYGTAKTSMLSMLGINETERDVVFAIVKTELAKDIVPQLKEEFDTNNIKNAFCCKISPSSANIGMLKHILNIGADKNEK